MTKSRRRTLIILVVALVLAIISIELVLLNIPSGDTRILRP